MLKLSFKDFKLDTDGKNTEEILKLTYDFLGKVYHDYMECHAPSIDLNSFVKGYNVALPPLAERLKPLNTPTDTSTNVDGAMKNRVPNLIDYNELDVHTAKGVEGFRCPKCHQSMTLKTTRTNGDTRILYRSKEGLYECTEDICINTDTIETYDTTIDANGIHLLAKYTESKVCLIPDTSTKCQCPRCHEEGDIEHFITEYAGPNGSEFERPCVKCGGEIVTISKKKENTNTDGDDLNMESTVKCESCGFDEYY